MNADPAQSEQPKVVPDRAARAEQAATLKAQGLNGLQIAERMGISRSYAYSLLNDPDGSGERQRKTKYDGVCKDCGGRTVGDGGLPPERCAPCSIEYQRSSAKWTKETIIAAIHEWVRLAGRAPAATDWNTGVAVTGDRAALRRAGDWPATNTVVGKFGTWNAAIVAAGLEPRQPWSTQARLPTSEIERTVAMYQEGLSAAEIAARVGDITPGGIVERLKRAGVYTPTMKEANMSAPIKAEAVLDREIERAELRATRLRTELEEMDDVIRRLRLARTALDGLELVPPTDPETAHAA